MPVGTGLLGCVLPGRSSKLASFRGAEDGLSRCGGGLGENQMLRGGGRWGGGKAFLKRRRQAGKF